MVLDTVAFKQILGAFSALAGAGTVLEGQNL